jgi:hypothetical protein
MLVALPHTGAVIARLLVPGNRKSVDRFDLSLASDFGRFERAL